MRLPEIQLDDRRFQDLVSEARLKITRSCPEWTEHNVSDPGITLIELFAWMTEMTIYRLNRVPDKLHVSLLELLGIRLDGPSAAQTSLRFRLPEAAREPLTDRRPATEVGTPRTATEESIIFQVDESFDVPAAVPAAYVLQRGGQVKSIGLADGVAKPAGADQLAFASPPARRRRALPRLRGAARPPADRGRRRRLAGARRRREPRGPAAALGALPGRQRVARGRGARGPHRRLQLRLRHRHARAAAALGDPAAGRPPHALAALPDRRQDPPRRRRDDLHAAAGDLLDHRRRGRARGCPPRTPRRSPRRSSASPTARRARSSRCATRRCSSPQAGETLEVQDPESGDWARWELRDDFVGSTEFDRHFTLDLVSGEVEFGPAIRETDGGWTQYGSVPPKGAVLRFTRYRHGGGRTGNVTAGHADGAQEHARRASTRSPTPTPAVGGVDAEQLEHARERASMEIRSRYRAVTAEDFEFMAGEASPRVARAVCIPPREGGAVPLHIVPRVYPADRQLELRASWSPTRR